VNALIGDFAIVLARDLGHRYGRVQTPNAEDPARWRGGNLPGFAPMGARDRLRGT
jgi:hypothetical protein